MHIGHYISGLAHAGVIGWALWGGSFRDDPPPFEVSGVSIVTTEEFERALAAEQSPLTATEVTVPVAPSLSDAAPALSSEADETPELQTPDSASAEDPDSQPDLSDITAPKPAEVTDTAPTLSPPGEEMAVLIPRDQTRPMVRPSDRVAPQPVAPPPPDTKIDEVLQEATKPDDTPSDNVEEPKEETAPEEAATEIVTEAKEQVALAPKASLRPVLRPGSRPTPRPQTNSGSAASSSTDAAVAAVLGEEPAAPSGPPLTQGEKDSMRISVQNCWVVDVGGQSSNVTVTVRFNLDREGKVSSAIELLSSQGGDDRAVETAYQSARRAILRCQKGGYKLPIEKYDHWREVEITFNPEKMRLK
ncbi:energy transducer TonB family protein [Shimia sediminis]|uniref:energy transducer TonB family protein n=1 Tax=Shimia sediminis TaxID=2497945 RepID=UPI000F8EE673|nr:energy transducer TonB [Shimia sediminis]